jgi:hypothetical protein
MMKKFTRDQCKWELPENQEEFSRTHLLEKEICSLPIERIY